MWAKPKELEFMRAATAWRCTAWPCRSSTMPICAPSQRSRCAGAEIWPERMLVLGARGLAIPVSRWNTWPSYQSCCCTSNQPSCQSSYLKWLNYRCASRSILSACQPAVCCMQPQLYACAQADYTPPSIHRILFQSLANSSVWTLLCK